ncbi:MAG: hypothetical protein KDB35_20935, partial [Acidimicrobiales bacterium]|nr:hypothetical protein [Acidimicrobiales bacterium]
MDRPKALALSLSITGVIAAAVAAVALNFGLIGAGASPAPTPALSGVTASGTAAVGQGTDATAADAVTGSSYGEHEDGE